jgi:hypothetical protein
MTDASIACSFAWFLIDGEPRFQHLWWKLSPSLGTHLALYELKVITHHRIGRPNADIHLLCNFINHHSSVLKNQFLSSSFCAVVTVVGRSECSASVKFVRPFLNISVHSERESIAPPYWVHVLMYLFTQYTCSQKTYHRSLLLLGAILQVLLPWSPFHSNSLTNCKVNRLALPTIHMPPYNTPLPLIQFSLKI